MGEKTEIIVRMNRLAIYKPGLSDQAETSLSERADVTWYYTTKKRRSNGHKNALMQYYESVI